MISYTRTNDIHERIEYLPKRYMKDVFFEKDQNPYRGTNRGAKKVAKTNLVDSFRACDHYIDGIAGLFTDNFNK